MIMANTAARSFSTDFAGASLLLEEGSSHSGLASFAASLEGRLDEVRLLLSEG